MNRETLSKKPVKFLTLLSTAMLIATASAAVYYSLNMQPTVTISQAVVKFVQGDDWPSGSSMGTNSTHVSLAIKAYPNVTLTYEEPLNISLHDGTSSNQIAVSGGNIVKSEGSPYNLAGNTTIYIAISNLQATTTDTSYLYVHLKLLVPSTSVYMLYVITFEIT